jgi:predicted DNA-binding protein (MmcQ/YjbR family)
MREKVLKWALDTYGAQPQYLWARYPDYAVLRHENNGKWFALVGGVKRSALGLESDEIVDIVDVKCEPEEIDFLSQQPGFFHGYHMNKNHWLTILLDGTVPMETVCGLIERSFDLTAPKIKKKK